MVKTVKDHVATKTSPNGPRTTLRLRPKLHLIIIFKNFYAPFACAFLAMRVFFIFVFLLRELVVEGEKGRVFGCMCVGVGFGFGD
jgi:hypothetical protein